MVMPPAVRRIAIDIETLVWEGLLTGLASKASRMPLALQFAILSTDGLLLHGQVARSALWQEQLSKVFGAVDPSVLLHMAHRLLNGLLTLVTGQVVFVPGLSQSIDGRLAA